ncbi:putative bifunctional diguanylate cyclase/phosphodiesterase [Roseateles sp. BYS180W]|uniref:Bifunctional diguanylate cyclase/phosphodiesterase n=1 Tax=Roseateles rivi TaxID=3299028 RepID=A0ABW7FTX2_9BURK
MIIDAWRGEWAAAAFGLCLFLGMLSYARKWRGRVQQQDDELQRLHRDSHQMRAVLNTAPDPMVLWDAQGWPLGCNSAFEQLSALSEAQLLAGGSALVPDWLRAHEPGRSLCWVDDASGQRRCMDVEHVTVWPHLNQPGMLTVARDITRQQQALEHARVAGLVFENAVEGIVVLDDRDRICDINPALCRLLGQSRAEVLGRHPMAMHNQAQDPEQLAELESSLVQQGRWSGELLAQSAEGQLLPLWATWVRFKNNEGRHMTLGVLTDMTPIKEAEAKLLHQRLHDPLTGLPNALLMRDRIERQIIQARRDASNIAVLFADLDGFREINELGGHGVGDAVLQEVARRFSGVVRASDSISRVGADEFVMLLAGLIDEARAMSMGERLIQCLAEPVQVDEQTFNLGVTVGLALFPADGIEVEVLLRHAEAAMARAKKEARGTVQAYRPDLTAAAQRRIELVHALRLAQDMGQFHLEYQPQVRVRDGSLIGAEALMRWRIPGKGPVSPLDFIPLAEETGLIIAMGRWVLEQACAQAVLWQAQANMPPVVAVNVSARQLRQPDFLKVLDDVLQRSGCPPHALELEVTESMLLEESDQAIALLYEIAKRGVRVALDDFGTGYSSLAYLRRLPVHTLKLDRSFVKELGQDRQVEAIARTIIRLARDLSLEVLAEGVETPEQVRWLRLAGCDWAQGWCYGKPMRPEGFQYAAPDIAETGVFVDTLVQDEPSTVGPALQALASE